MAKSGYINGSDLLLSINGKAVGHCSTHTLTFSSETKDRAVKPVSTEDVSTAGLFKSKSVTGLSVSVSGDGYRNYNETESGFKALLAAYAAGESVEVCAFERESDETPYMKGDFVITSLEETSPAEDDATYTISLENDGVVEFDTDSLTEE